MNDQQTLVRHLGIQPYDVIWDKMKQFTLQRQPDTQDELWIVQHYPVYTQGQAGKAEHIHHAKDIPIVQTDRGGQVTYHGPGQLIAYTLMNLHRRQLGIRTLVCHLEQTLINLLQIYQIQATRRPSAPGVYVDNKKIASIGLRVKNGYTYHGIALNVSLDMSPFDGINPCGYNDLKMTQMNNFVPEIDIDQVTTQFIEHFMQIFCRPNLGV